jgi:hypothetical protein
MDIEVVLGSSARLGLELTDGANGLFPRATVYNGSPVPLTNVDLVGVSLGLYRALWTPPYAGHFDVVYRVFADAGHTQLADYEHSLDRVLAITPNDQPLLGAAYDDTSGTLRLEASLSRGGLALTAPTVTAVTLDVYDSDDSILFTVSDLAPDGQGLFRMTRSAPGLVADRLYSVKMTFTTAYGTFVGRRGFMTTT